MWSEVDRYIADKLIRDDPETRTEGLPPHELTPPQPRRPRRRRGDHRPGARHAPVFDALAAEPGVRATVIQTVGSKGYDGFALALGAG